MPNDWLLFRKNDVDLAKIDEVLVPLSQSAYRAEMLGNWSEAYNLHKRAEDEWGAFANTAKALSVQQRIYKQMSQTRCKLHHERLDAIRPFAKEGQPIPEQLAMHPSVELAAAGVSHLVSPSQLAAIAAEGRKALSAALPPSDSSYTSTLPTGAPPTEYLMRCDLEGINYWPGRLRHIVLSLIDPKTNTTLLILESWARQKDRGESEPGVREALVYRPADHPTPAFRIRPTERVSILTTSPMPLQTTIFGIDGVVVNDGPDRRGTRFTCRRFGWDGHAFVRKPIDKLGSYLAVHEYFNSTPVQGSKTGKREDDSLPTKLFWLDYKKSGFKSSALFANEWKAFAAAGLHPLMREYIAAIQLMDILIVKVGASPARGQPASTGEVAALVGARSALIVLLGIVIGAS